MTHDAPSDAPGPTAEARAEARRRMLARRRRTFAVAGTALLVLGGYTAACALTPLPELRPELTVPEEEVSEADATAMEEAPESQSDPTAIGWADGDEVWANDDAPREMASVTKLVTVLVGLEAEPVEEGDGPTYTVTEADAQIRERVLADDGVAADAPAGLELTTRQMLELTLLPSANNYAIAYADWTLGGERQFAEAAADWAERHGLDTLEVVEPSGLSPENVASPADIVRVSRLALEHPLIAEIVAEPWADIPGIGPIENTNPLLGEQGVVGLKTGTTTTAGHNLAAARRFSADERELTAIAVVLGRDDEGRRAEDARTMLDAAQETVDTVPLVEEGDAVGRVVVWDGQEVPLLASGGSAATLVPGETATLSAQTGMIGAGERGGTVGVLRAETPEGREQIPVVTGAAIAEPDLWWRLAHPQIIFGWVEP